MLKSVFIFYRPTYPSWRAQDIQVLHTAHSLANRGHVVTLLANRSNRKIEKKDVLSQFNLQPNPNLLLKMSPSTHPGKSGLWFRFHLLKWWKNNQGVVLTRDLERLSQMLKFLKKKQSIFIEAHQLPSILAADDGAPVASLKAIESHILKHATGLLTNCGGVMRLWEEAYPKSLPQLRAVVHNGTSPSRAQYIDSHDNVIRCMGSLRPEKGISELIPILAKSDESYEFLGGRKDEIKSLPPLPENIKVLDAVPYPDVPQYLISSKALLLPLQNNRFGRDLTSPLKLWDYLATDRPIIAPSLGSTREIQALCGRDLLFYEPDNSETLLDVISAIPTSPFVPYLRSWDDRADELSRLFQS